MKTQRDLQAPSSHGWFKPKPVIWLAGFLLVVSAGGWFWRRSIVHDLPPAGRDQAEHGVASQLPGLSPKNAEATEAAATGGETLSLERRETIAAALQQLCAEGSYRQVRRHASESLVKDGSQLALDALQKALALKNPEVRELIAEALGQSPRPESHGLLVGLLGDASDVVAMAAIRGLSAQGTPAGATAINTVLLDAARGTDVRAEAAAGLGTMARAEALDALTAAIGLVQENSVLSEVVRSLGRRPIEETQNVLRSFLDSPHTPAELKVDAVEGLAEAKGDATPFLLEYARHTDPEVRSAALWAMASLETPGHAGAELMAQLDVEASPAMRKHLYQALANQQQFDLQRAWEHITAEKESVSRLAGLDFLARVVQRSPTPEMVTFFDQRAVPELKQAALDGTVRDARMSAVLTLRRARTASSFAALRDIGRQGADSAVTSATGF